MTDPELYRRFVEAWDTARHHPWRARWRRRDRVIALMVQRLGLHVRTSAPLFWPARLEILTGETVSRSILAFRYSEPAITALLCELLHPGDITVDVGAHLGYETMLMSQLVGTTGQVHAFEPNPDILPFTQANISGYPQAVLHSCAAGDQNGFVELVVPPVTRSVFAQVAAPGAVGRRIRVKMTRLEDELPAASAPVKLIKCDAEGHEEAILRGADRLLRDRPSLILETGMPPAGQLPPRSATLLEHLSDFGYDAFCFRFDGALQVAPEGSFTSGHASSLFLTKDHPRFSAFSAGWTRSA